MINTIYEIEDYDESVGQVRLRLLKDSNGILISKTNTYGIVKKMIRATLLDLHYQIVPQKEENEIREQLQTDKNNKVQIKFTVMDLGDDIECIPQQMLPENISMQEYEIKFNKSERRIENVISKKFGPVEFVSQQIDDHATYVMGSVIKVWTNTINMAFGHENAEFLNIIQIALNDMGDDASIDVVYLKKGETKEDHKEFSTDQMGVTLRYKVLVKNYTIHDILYNTGSSIESLPFQEMRLEVGQPYLVKGVDEITDQVMFGIINEIPISMLACEERFRGFADTLDAGQVKYPMFGVSNSRGFERLLGYIDIDLCSLDGLQTFSDDPMMISVPADKLDIPDDMSKMLYQSHMEFSEQQKKSKYSDALDAFVQLVTRYDDREERKAIEKDLTSMQEYFKKL